MSRRYGWKRQQHDHRDFQRLGALGAAPLPSKVDLRPKCPPVYDQGKLGSCTANTVVFQSQFLDGEFLSRLFLYFETRLSEGTAGVDCGCALRDVYKVLRSKGACLEKLWPYDPSRFNVRPSASACLEAKAHQALAYHSVTQTEHALKEALASGLPVGFGFDVFESFESEAVTKSGIAPMPSAHENEIGGHAVALVGYDDTTRMFLVRNSWGDGWGQRGYFWMPYDYVTNPSLASDFWVLSRVE